MVPRGCHFPEESAQIDSKLKLPEEMVFPDYSGTTVANVPGTIASLLEVPFKGLPPLRSSLWNPIAGDIRRVVVILVDALGQNIFAREENNLAGLIRRADTLGQITSVFCRGKREALYKRGLNPHILYGPRNRTLIMKQCKDSGVGK